MSKNPKLSFKIDKKLDIEKIEHFLKRRKHKSGANMRESILSKHPSLKAGKVRKYVEDYYEQNSLVKLVEGLEEQGYSNEEIAAYIAGRIYYARAEHMRKDGWDLAEVSDEVNFDDNIKKDLERLPRADGQEWTFDLLNQEYKKATGVDLSLSTNNALNADGSYVASKDRYIHCRAGFLVLKLIPFL